MVEMTTMLREPKLPDEYYDEGSGVSYDFPVIYPNPNWRERKDIEFLKTFAVGVMLVTGKARSGKDLWGTSVSFKNKLYFGRPILLDFKPKKQFGYYTYIDPRWLQNEADKMAKLAGVSSDDNPDKPYKEEEEKVLALAGKEWVESKDIHVLLENAVLYLSELKRYCYNRNPHNPVNKLIGSICTQYGHLNLLIIGTHIQLHEIDQYSFQEYVTHWVKCSWSLTRPNTSEVTLVRGTFLSGNGMFDVVTPPVKIYVDGAKPRDYLDGKSFFDLWNSKNKVNLKPSVRKEM